MRFHCIFIGSMIFLLLLTTAELISLYGFLLLYGTLCWRDCVSVAIFAEFSAVLSAFFSLCACFSSLGVSNWSLMTFRRRQSSFRGPFTVLDLQVFRRMAVFGCSALRRIN